MLMEASNRENIRIRLLRRTQPRQKGAFFLVCLFCFLTITFSLSDGVLVKEENMLKEG